MGGGQSCADVGPGTPVHESLNTGSPSASRQSSKYIFRASVRHPEGNSVVGVARFGLIDRMAQVYLCNLLRPDTPKQFRANRASAPDACRKAWLADHSLCGAGLWQGL